MDTQLLESGLAEFLDRARDAFLTDSSYAEQIALAAASLRARRGEDLQID